MKKISSYSLIFGLLLSGTTPTFHATSISDSKKIAKNEGWGKVNQKIFIYEVKPYGEIFLATFILCGGLFYSSLMFSSDPQPNKKKDYVLHYALTSSFLGTCLAVSTYFGYKAFKKRHQAKVALLILSPQGIEDKKGNFYPWEQIESIRTYSANYQFSDPRELTLYLKNSQNLVVETTDMAISDKTLWTLIKRYKYFEVTPGWPLPLNEMRKSIENLENLAKNRKSPD